MLKLYTRMEECPVHAGWIEEPNTGDDADAPERPLRTRMARKEMGRAMRAQSKRPLRARMARAPVRPARRAGANAPCARGWPTVLSARDLSAYMPPVRWEGSNATAASGTPLRAVQGQPAWANMRNSRGTLLARCAGKAMNVFPGRKPRKALRCKTAPRERMGDGYASAPSSSSRPPRMTISSGAGSPLRS